MFSCCFKIHFLCSILKFPAIIHNTCKKIITVYLLLAHPVRIRQYSGSLCKYFCCGKEISITYSECVFVALGIQQAMHMRHIVICGLSALQYFTPYLMKCTIFEKEKKMLLNIKCVFWFSLQILSEKFFYSRNNWARYDKNVCWSSCKVPVTLVRFYFHSLNLFSNSNGSLRKCFLVVQNRVTVTNLQIMFLKLKWLAKSLSLYLL